MTDTKQTHEAVLLANPRLIFQTSTKVTAKGYLKKKPHKLEPLKNKHDSMADKKSRNLAKATDAVKMPSQMFDSVIDQDTLLEEYRRLIDNQHELPGINAAVNPKRGKTYNKTKSVNKTPRQRKLREAEWKKGKPLFTEGLSSKSVQDEPVFYLRNQLVINSNQPGGVHYIRDRSKLILEATVGDKGRKTKEQPTRQSVTSWSMPKLAETPTWGNKKGNVQVTRNNTILLPKVFVNQELPLIDSTSRSLSNRSGMYTPRDLVSTDLIPVSEDITENAYGAKTLAKLKISEYPEEVKTPLNSPVKPLSGITYQTQNQDIDSKTSDDKSRIGPLDDSRLQISSQKGARRHIEAPSVVSIGNSEDMEFTRRYRPTGKSSVAGMDWSDIETRPSTMESRMALSTPGRRMKPKKAQLDSMSLGVIESRAGTQTKVVISEEENMVYNFVYETDQKTEARIPKIMFGDPLKDSKRQDKKLNNSKLSDLYQRGIIQAHKAGGPSPRIKSKEDIKNILAGNFRSRASVQSTMALRNPPPSIATATSSPPYGVGKPGMKVVQEFDDSHKEKELVEELNPLHITDGEMSIKLEDMTEGIDNNAE